MKAVKKPPARSKILFVRLRPEEHKRFQSFAWSEGKGMAECARDIILEAIKREK